MAATFIIINNEHRPAWASGLRRRPAHRARRRRPSRRPRVARFGDPIPTDPVVFNDMAGKG